MMTSPTWMSATFLFAICCRSLGAMWRQFWLSVQLTLEPNTSTE